jgi:hypothetical protein
MTYLVADLSPGLQGFGGDFLALFCDPRLPTVSALGLGRSSIVDVLRGVSTALSPVDAALRGVPTDGAVTALGDLALSSSSSMLMVSTLELTMAMSTDTVGPVLFRFYFLASTVWVAVIVAAAREAGILPVACRVHHSADLVTLGGALLVAGASSSHPHRRIGDVLLAGRLRGCLHVRHNTNLVAALFFVVQWSGAQVDALTVLQSKQDRKDKETCVRIA